MPRLTVTPTFGAVCVFLAVMSGRDLLAREVSVLPEFPPRPADPLDPAYLEAITRAGNTPVQSYPLHAAGGFVEFADDDRLTNRRFALIVAAGPLVTALLTAGVYLATQRDFGFSAPAIVADRLLSLALFVNAFALVVKLLPFRGLDGWHLLRSAPRRRARGGKHVR